MNDALFAGALIGIAALCVLIRIGLFGLGDAVDKVPNVFHKKSRME
jgi:hypothetical protein